MKRTVFLGFAMTAIASGAGPYSHGVLAADVPQASCPAQLSDQAFLPCGEKFLMQPGPGQSLAPYTGQDLPSDGPVLDLFAGDRSFSSRNGVLKTTFTLTTGTADDPMAVGSKPYHVITYPGQGRLGGVVTSYNGIFPGPTLTAQPGDTIRLKMQDRRVPSAQLQKSILAFDPTDPVPEQSNIHTHGMLVSPTGRGDNIYRSFLPGNDYLTEIEIPADHDHGINWYHPHFHRSTAAQVYGGMAGILQIGNVIGANRRAEYRGLAQHTLVLSGMDLAASKDHPGMFVIGPTGTGTSPHFVDPNPAVAQGSPSAAPEYAPTYFVNGQVNPIIAMRPGETQVWTIANVSPFAAYSLGIFGIGADGEVGPSAPLFRSVLIAQDGNDHFSSVEAWFIKQRDLNKDTFVAPGERITWAITAPKVPGDYFLANVRDSAYTDQVSNLPAMLTFEPPQSFVPSVIMATVRVAGEPVTTPPPSADHEYPPAELALEPDIVRKIAFDFEEHTFRGRINFGGFPDLAMAQSFSGDIERWVVSTYSQVSHPFHIHQGQFVIEKIEYYEDLALTKLRTDLPANPVINDVPRDIDTFAFPGRSKVYIKLKASAFVGKFVMHCHLLLHEDSGMMVTVRVLPPREEVLTAIGTGPGEAPVVTLTRADEGKFAGSFQAYPDGYTGGVQADAGHLLPPYDAHVVTIRRAGEPRVRVFDRKRLDAPDLELVPFDGAGDGGSIALGDVNGDSIDEIVVGSGKGHKPTVEVYKVEASSDGSLTSHLLWELPVLDDRYQAGGVRVASGDVDGDNWDDIVVANGPGAQNRVVVLSGQALTRGDSGNVLIIDQPGIVPGDEGLNVAADNLAGGFFRYPPITVVGMNPPAPSPYRAVIALTRATAAEDPEISMFYYLGGGGHSHGAEADHSLLRPVVEFTPFPGEQAPAEGLVLKTALTLVVDPGNPLIGLVSANGSDQRVSYFNIEGEIETKPWATAD